MLWTVALDSGYVLSIRIIPLEKFAVLKELLVSFLICLVIGAVINGNSGPAPAPTSDTSTSTPAESSSDLTGDASPSTEAAPETSDATFDQDVLKSQVPVLVDFSAPWCAPCRDMAPIVDKIAQDYEGKAKVFKVDTDRNPGLKEKYQIQAWPTFMVFRDGRSVAQHSGAMPKEMLAGVIDTQLGVR